VLTHPERIGGPLRPADEHGLALYAPKFGQVPITRGSVGVMERISLDAPVYSQNCAVLISRPILGNVLFDLFDRVVMG
jgi:hypothetical protein